MAGLKSKLKMPAADLAEEGMGSIEPSGANSRTQGKAWSYSWTAPRRVQSVTQTSQT
jgi:hypothetical protein